MILLAVSTPDEARAQGTATATLQVSVRVVRYCSVSADSSAVDSNTSVRVMCGRSALRALRVSAAPDAAEYLIPLVAAGPQRLAGGEMTFTVPATGLVTLDF